jgi:hypothetical protein
MLKPKSSQHTFTNKLKKFQQMLSACQKTDGNCLLDQESGADGTVHATKNHNNIRGVLRNTKKKNCVRPAIQNKLRGMLTSAIRLLHNNVHPHTAAHARPLLEHFNWELSNHPPYSPDLALSDYHLFTYLKNWL